MNPQQESNLPPGLSRPAQRALTNAGYRRLDQLTRVSRAEVEGLHGVGPKALAQLRHALDANGLSFADGKKAD
ncbi:MAG: DNA-binding protein [Actinomycetota bacterium]|nr:DNA-binding protein [Actinomycetota bacterium]